MACVCFVFGVCGRFTCAFGASSAGAQPSLAHNRIVLNDVSSSLPLPPFILWAARRKPSGAPVEQRAGQKRSIGRDIEKNKGHTPSRKKDIARVRLRKKFRAAVRKRRGAVRPMREKQARYGGEETGISTNVARSRKLDKV